MTFVHRQIRLALPTQNSVDLFLYQWLSLSIQPITSWWQILCESCCTKLISVGYWFVSKTNLNNTQFSRQLDFSIDLSIPIITIALIMVNASFKLLYVIIHYFIFWFWDNYWRILELIVVINVNKYLSNYLVWYSVVIKELSHFFTWADN